MRVLTRCVLPLLIVALASGEIAADGVTNDTGNDIAFITIKNRYQAELVGEIIDHAYTKVGQKFLVSLDAHQRDLLSRSGIEFEVILPDADPAATYIVRPMCHAEPGLVDWSELGKTVDIGLGMHLVAMSRVAASAIAENTGFVATPLDQMRVRFHYVPPAVANLLAGLEDFPSDSLAARVSLDSVYAYNTRLEAFYTRYIWTDSIDRARDWIVQKFLDWGYTDVTTPTFWWNGDWHYNVMAIKPGYAEPDKVIVVGGHYDSITYGEEPGPMIYAPGSDDNGSGTTTTMELARVLADVPLRKTIIFMAFSAEEVGLVGSQAAAQEFVNAGTDIEVMYNFDMVGYTEDTYWDISVTSGPNAAYRQLTAEAATRVTSLIPIVGMSPGGSDHQSFREQGYNIVNTIEADFNYPGWHTNLDLTSRMDFPYLTEVVKMAVASIAIIADAAHPTEIEEIVDQGDGQSLEIFWSDCNPSYTYTIYYGASSGSYTDSVEISPGLCSYVVSGLTEGLTYYFSVVGKAPDGYPALYSVEGSGTPYLVPRAPTSLTAEPDFSQIILNWEDNREADFAYYRIYRQLQGLAWSLYEDNVQASSSVDTQVVGQVNYGYRITAVDYDAYESDFSNEADAYAATFDGGVLVVDEMTQGAGMPSQEGQEALFDTLFGETPYGLYRVETYDDALIRSVAGRYSSIFWFDDDLATKIIGESEDTLAWYAGFTGNLFVCGLRTIRFWAPSVLSPGELLYDEFGLASYTENSASDFAGAKGESGWPSVQADPETMFGGKLPVIPKLTPRPGATVIYTFDSFVDDPAFEGEPCGLVYSGPNGSRVVLGFPLYFLDHAGAESLISYAKALFGETGTVASNGDVDGSGFVDIADLVYLVDFLFRSGPGLPDPNAADVDASCIIDIADVVYFVLYLFRDGPEPQAGCVEP